MNKITIEITATGWTTTVSINGETFSEKFERTSTGAICVEGNLEGVKQIPDEVIDSILFRDKKSLIEYLESKE